SEDGRNIAYSGMAGGATQVFVRSLDAPTSVQLTSLPQGAYFPFWSPDGSRVYFSSAFRTSRDLMAVGSSGGTPEMVLSGLGGHFFLEGATISHDGKTLAVFRQDPATGVYSIWTSSPPGAALHRIEPSPFQQTTLGAPVTLGFSHDDKQLLFVFGNPALDRPDFWIIPWPEGTGPARRVLQSIPRSTPFVAARWMPDNQHLLLALQPKDRSAGHLWIADIRSGGLRPLTGGYQSESYSDVSPDGKRIVYSTWNDDFDVVEFAANGSGGVHNLLSTRRSEYAPAWSPVRQQFAYVTDRNGDNEIWLHSEAEGTDRPLVTRKDFPGTVVEAFLSPTFSPDGQRIAYGVYDSTGSNIWISSISGSSPVRVLPPGVVKSIPAPAWSPDGDWIAYRSERPEGTALEKIRVGSGSPVSIVKTPVPFAPQWSPDGKWISMQTEEGFTIVSPDGAEKHVLNHRPDPGRGYAYGWERSGKSILAVTPEVTGHTALIRIDVPSGAEHRIADLGADRSFEGRYLWDVRLSISPDGSRVASARTNRTADLWMIAGFDQPRGLLERWLRGRR
ncbi:MAG TPA: hypothetical protein VEF06_14015, partial [Bryobacteraceae bacterium]|nr:hypothetical protein [Bryobacteraceae bacterium]